MNGSPRAAENAHAGPRAGTFRTALGVLVAAQVAIGLYQHVVYFRERAGVFPSSLDHGSGRSIFLVAAVLAVQALRTGTAPLRPVDAEWRDRPTRLTARRVQDGR